MTNMEIENLLEEIIVRVEVDVDVENEFQSNPLPNIEGKILFYNFPFI